MNIYKRIILFIALISFLLSCKNSTNANVNVNTNNISSVIFEDIIHYGGIEIFNAYIDDNI